ncbi:UNVERIFIED_CONTAM: protein CHUP1, chloroplastic [Sesamum radiatum]|uniref:Protein CHUP1, chloroplastic n=1 Tax=Sesamum radiatum TaxID=300843 RepID=A0AAW2T190_SESRA
MKSSWGSHIVKGFSAADKKTKTRVLQATAQSKKLPVHNSDSSNQKNQPLVSNSRTKRSLIGDLSCSINAIQVLELERELELKKSEIDGLLKRVGCLENEKANLSGQLVSLASVMGKQEDVLESEACDHFGSVEMEVLELRRLNKELQLQKRNLSGRISSLESQLATLAKVSESDIVEIKAEASLLRHTNEDLCKQVEGLQMSRMNEVEELAYLRWVNSCLRDELRSCSTRSSDKPTSPNSVEKSRESICFSPFQMDQDSNDTATRRLYLVKKFKRWPYY